MKSTTLKTGLSLAVIALFAAGCSTYPAYMTCYGPDGPAGPTGATGPQGATGATGMQGAPSAAGLIGPRGPTGPTGAQGAIGETGPQGPRSGRQQTIAGKLQYVIQRTDGGFEREHDGRMAAQAYSLLFAALLACSAVDAAAQTVYKDVDDEGRTSFSDQPPPRPAVRPRRGGKVDVNEAARRLKQARLERKQGAEPRAGEFTQGPGAPKANYRYWQRQEKLRLVVERALRRSNETLRLQLASR
jgi:hypothetical protein